MRTSTDIEVRYEMDAHYMRSRKQGSRHSFMTSTVFYCVRSHTQQWPTPHTGAKCQRPWFTDRATFSFWGPTEVRTHTKPDAHMCADACTCPCQDVWQPCHGAWTGLDTCAFQINVTGSATLADRLFVRPATSSYVYVQAHQPLLLQVLQKETKR